MTLAAQGTNTALPAELHMAHSQLALYARDLKRAVDAERRKTRELAEANRRLQHLDRLKDDFLIFISHELRTPLVGMSAISMAQPGGDPQTQALLIELIRHGYERLQAFIEAGLNYFQWLSVEEPDAGSITDLARLARDLAVEPVGREVQVVVPEGPCLVRGAYRHLEQVVRILLDNARKFSPEAAPVVVSIQASRPIVTLTVIDQGRGFAPDRSDEFFQPFTIGDVDHHSRGTGLNLALAAAIVAAHGGQIRGESPGIGQGAKFQVELPLAAPPPATVYPSGADT